MPLLSADSPVLSPSRAAAGQVLGKVSVKKEDLRKYYGKDHWFDILPVDCDSEVQGEVHLEVRLESIQKSEDAPTQTRLSVRWVSGITDGPRRRRTYCYSS